MPSPPISSLVLDTSALLTSSSPLSTLRGLAKRYVTVRQVLDEVRDQGSREWMDQLSMLGEGSENGNGGGVEVKQPTTESLARVTAIARKTGDIGRLSQTDLLVLALTVTLEVEANGGWRVKDSAGETAKKKRDRELGSRPKVQNQTQKQGAENATNAKNNSNQEETREASTVSSDQGVPEIQQLSIHDSNTRTQENASDEDPETTKDVEENPIRENIDSAPGLQDDFSDSDSEEEDEESDSTDSSDWITPSNISSGPHPFADPSSKSSALPISASKFSRNNKKNNRWTKSGHNQAPPKNVDSACMTGDFAIQNVCLQMGLEVLGVGGKRVREVRTWVKRCHGCFKVTSSETSTFCPSCGGATLLPCSITYVPPTPANPQGYILHLKRNYQYKNRGTRFPIPRYQGGHSKANGKGNLVLREDQKEWQRGVKKEKIRKEKEDKALKRAIEGGGSVDEWTPFVELDPKNRKGLGGEMPVYGYGRRNPNENRRGGGNRKRK